MIKLKEIREQRGLSQSQLAEKAGISLRTLQHYEAGYRDINKAQAITVYTLAKPLDCSMEDLIQV